MEIKLKVYYKFMMMKYYVLQIMEVTETPRVLEENGNNAKPGLKRLGIEPVAILRGGPGWGMPPQIFAGPPAWPPQFFLNFSYKFVWLTHRLQ